MGLFMQGINDLATWCKQNQRIDFLQEYDIEKNTCTPSEIMYGSNIKAWWRYPAGHLYEAPVRDRTRRNRGCLICQDREVLVGYNDVTTLYPELIKEWDFKKNKGIVEPDNITKISNKVVWWICPGGHSYEQRIVHRTVDGLGCPYCSGHRVLKGFNDLKTVAPDICEYWDYEKNETKPDQVSVGSAKKVWWKCRWCGETFLRSVVNQHRKGVFCPQCSVKKRTQKRRESIIVKRGSLLETHPELMQEWDYEKNQELGLLPEKLSAGSRKHAWWICNSCGHRWMASICSRTRANSTGCPLCGIEKSRSIRYANLLKNRGSLADSGSEVLLDWDYDKNVDTRPEDILATSAKSCWWFCHICGHSWKAQVYNRVNGIGCPNCAKERGSSFPEQAVFFYISQLYPDSINRDTHLGKELDIFIPSRNVAIEYDGVAFHKNRNKDETKGELCRDNRVALYRIREEGCPDLLDDVTTVSYSYKYGDWLELKHIIETISGIIGGTDRSIEVNIERDQTAIFGQYVTMKKQHSLQELYPEIAKEWNQTRNGKVLPSMVYGASEKAFWWKCPRGHEYKAPVARRTSSGHGCSYCSKQRLLVGYNDFATCYPEIAKETSYEKSSINFKKF